MPTDETDGGRPKAARVRTCIATRTAKPVEDLIRFVVGPGGALVPDLKAALPGRGVWVTADAAHVAKAQKTRAFARSMKRDLIVEGDLAARVDALLLERAREGLAITNKAGAVVVGFVQVEAALARKPLALLHAADAADDGCAKLDRKFRAAVGEGAEIIRLFTGDQLDLALGRSNVVHAALERGPAATACLQRIRALVRFRGGVLSKVVVARSADMIGAAETDWE